MKAVDILNLFSRFEKRLRSGLRSGVLSRRPLEILRVELRSELHQASCDWRVRPVDPWDESLPEGAQAKLQSQQVLHDALAMRSLIFRHFPSVRSIELRAFRTNAEGDEELVLAGAVHRSDDVPPSVPSLAMRAHLSGFQFKQVDGVLSALPCEGLRHQYRS